MIGRRRPAVLALLTLLALLPFQNCGGKLGAAKSSTANSSQCKAQFKSEAVASRTSKNFNCSDFNQYQCERRVFSPDVEDMSHFLNECLPGGQICLDVEVRQFSTAGARASDPAELFLAGAAYNREEFRCHHRFTYRDEAVFTGEGDSMEEALALAMRSCEEAVEAR